MSEGARSLNGLYKTTNVAGTNINPSLFGVMPSKPADINDSGEGATNCLFSFVGEGTPLSKKDFEYYSKKTPSEVSYQIMDFFQHIDEKKSQQEVERSIIDFISQIENYVVCGVEVDLKLIGDLISKIEEAAPSKEKPSSRRKHPLLAEEKNDDVFKKYPQMLEFLEERIDQLKFYKLGVLDLKSIEAVGSTGGTCSEVGDLGLATNEANSLFPSLN